MLFHYTTKSEQTKKGDVISVTKPLNDSLEQSLHLFRLPGGATRNSSLITTRKRRQCSCLNSNDVIAVAANVFQLFRQFVRRLRIHFVDHNQFRPHQADILTQCRVEADVDKQRRFSLQMGRPAILAVVSGNVHAVNRALWQSGNNPAADETLSTEHNDRRVFVQSFERLHFANHLLYGFNGHIGFGRFSHQPLHEEHSGKNSCESLVLCAEKLSEPLHSLNELAKFILICRVAELAVVSRDGELDANLSVLAEKTNRSWSPLMPPRPVSIRVSKSIIVSCRINEKNRFNHTDPFVNQSDQPKNPIVIEKQVQQLCEEPAGMGLKKSRTRFLRCNCALVNPLVRESHLGRLQSHSDGLVHDSLLPFSRFTFQRTISWETLPTLLVFTIPRSRVIVKFKN